MQVIAAVAEFERDLLIERTNAGVERAGAIEEQPLDDFRATMETNYFGCLRCIKAVVPQMRERRAEFDEAKAQAAVIRAGADTRHYAAHDEIG